MKSVKIYLIERDKGIVEAELIAQYINKDHVKTHIVKLNGNKEKTKGLIFPRTKEIKDIFDNFNPNEHLKIARLLRMTITPNITVQSKRKSNISKKLFNSLEEQHII